MSSHLYLIWMPRGIMVQNFVFVAKCAQFNPYLSHIHWTRPYISTSVVQALSINELDGMTFYVTDVNGTTDDPQFSCTNVLR